MFDHQNSNYEFRAKIPATLSLWITNGFPRTDMRAYADPSRNVSNLPKWSQSSAGVLYGQYVVQISQKQKQQKLIIANCSYTSKAAENPTGPKCPRMDCNHFTAQGPEALPDEPGIKLQHYNTIGRHDQGKATRVASTSAAGCRHVFEDGTLKEARNLT